MSEKSFKKDNDNANEGNANIKPTKLNAGKTFTSPPIKLEFNIDEHEFYRADIEFYGIDISGPSYEGRVFLNNPNANENTPLEEEQGYVDSYHIFGHGGCFGDEGHCEIKPRRTYDSRPQHDLTPAYKSLIATNVIRKILKSTDEITITVVPMISRGGRMSDTKDVVYIDRIRISCYENYIKLNPQ
jgi:hypothetical protein